jgi:hypothetical protein
MNVYSWMKLALTGVCIAHMDGLRLEHLAKLMFKRREQMSASWVLFVTTSVTTAAVATTTTAEIITTTSAS